MMRLRSAFLITASLALLAFSLPAQTTDARQRIRAIQDLAKEGGSTIIPELQGYLRDPEFQVRLEAVKAIVSIGTQHSLDALVEATRDNDPEIQVRATDGLVNFYYPGYVQTGLTATLRRVGSGIKAKFTDTNDQIIDAYIQVRPDVIEALGKLARGAASLEARANAARAIGILRGGEAIPDLLEALRTKDTQVIYEVLIALQKIRDPEAAPKFAFLLRDLDEKVQIAAIETAGLLQNKAALPDLKEVLERTRDKDVRRAALIAIAMLPDESSRPLYERYLKDRDDQMRAAAAEGFARLKNSSDAELLERSFEQENKMKPRLSLCFALVMLGRNQVTEFSPLRYLINTLNSGSYKGIAYAFLVELARDKQVREQIYPVMNERTKDEKIALATVLGRTGAEDALPAVEALSRDGDLEVAQEATKALRLLRARMP